MPFSQHGSISLFSNGIHFTFRVQVFSLEEDIGHRVQSISVAIVQYISHVAIFLVRFPSRLPAYTAEESTVGSRDWPLSALCASFRSEAFRLL